MLKSLLRTLLRRPLLIANKIYLRLCDHPRDYYLDLCQHPIRNVAVPARSKDPFWFVVEFSEIVYPEYRFKWPQLDWWEDQRFFDILAKFGECPGGSEGPGLNSDRRWMIRQLLRLTVDVTGDSAEVGVFRGLGSYLICDTQQTMKLDRTHWIFDSFAGLSSPETSDGEYWKQGDLSIGLAEVRENLSDFPDIEYRQGFIPECFKDVTATAFAFVHIDVDLLQPTLDSLEYFYPQVADGGIMLFDDYGSTICPGATKCIDEFFADKPEKPISLSGGGALIIKGIVCG